MDYEINYNSEKNLPLGDYGSSRGYSLSCPTCGGSDRASHIGKYRLNKPISLDDIPVIKSL